jgi:hypothetical protein
MTRTPIGYFIVRAWVEPGSSSPLRAHIRHTTDVSEGFDRDFTLAEEEAVVAAVRAWLSAMLAGSPGVGDNADGPS